MEAVHEHVATARGIAAAPMLRLTVVVPAYNEAALLEAFHARLARVLDELPMDCSVLYVDGSSDRTWPLIKSLTSRDTRHHQALA